jgi:hypothetical protein
MAFWKLSRGIACGRFFKGCFAGVRLLLSWRDRDALIVDLAMVGRVGETDTINHDIVPFSLLALAIDRPRCNRMMSNAGRSLYSKSQACRPDLSNPTCK